MNQCHFLNELGGLLLSVFVAVAISFSIVLVFVYFAAFLEKIIARRSVLKAVKLKHHFLLLLLPPSVPIILSSLNLFDNNEINFWLFVLGMLLAVIVCFYSLYKIRKDYKSIGVFLIGMFFTASVIHILLVTFYVFKGLIVYASFMSIVQPVSYWFGVTDDTANKLILLKVFSHIYMGLFIGVAATWLNIGFNRKKGNE